MNQRKEHAQNIGRATMFKQVYIYVNLHFNKIKLPTKHKGVINLFAISHRIING